MIISQCSGTQADQGPYKNCSFPHPRLQLSLEFRVKGEISGSNGAWSKKARVLALGHLAVGPLAC